MTSCAPFQKFGIHLISTKDAKMPRILDQVVPDPDDLEAQVAFFKANSFVILPDLFSPDEAAEWNALSAHARHTTPFMWYCTTSRDYDCNLLCAPPRCDNMIRHPRILHLAQPLMGGPFCFGELAVRHTSADIEDRDTDWHRD